jgi:predicted RNA binding protein YcfA (HicA-like mRNA interferase family)
MNPKKLLEKAVASGGNLRFGDMQTLVKAFGFALIRVRGSHHIYARPDIPEQVNIQNRKGKAKPYQVRQFLELVEQHNLILGENA